jgi:hypothetical protein
MKMLTIIKKKKIITLDCFTFMAQIHELTPIAKSAKHFPEWMNTIGRSKTIESNPNGIVVNHTIKGCYGYMELYKRAVTLPAWCDMIFEITDEKLKFNIAAGKLPYSHDRVQYGKAFTDFMHCKLCSPWCIKEKSGVHFAWVPHTWNLENYINMVILPAVIEFKANNNADINVFFKKSKDKYPYRLDIHMGQPLVHFIPLQDDAIINPVCHLVSEAEHERLKNYTGTFWSFRDLIKLSRKI